MEVCTCNTMVAVCKPYAADWSPLNSSAHCRGQETASNNNYTAALRMLTSSGTQPVLFSTACWACEVLTCCYVEASIILLGRGGRLVSVQAVGSSSATK